MSREGVALCSCQHLPRVLLQRSYKGQLMHTSKIKQTWTDLFRRCYDSNNPGYKYYGEKNITVCPAWHDYATFHRDLANTWFPGATLDRTDPKGNYEPGNCTWIPQQDQTSVGKQTLRYNNKTGAIGVEILPNGHYRVIVRERGWPRGKGPKRSLYRGPDFEQAKAIRTGGGR